MQRMSAIYLCLAVVASGLAGCAPPLYQTAAWDSGQPPHYSVYWGTFPEQPPDYSPDHTSVPPTAPTINLEHDAKGACPLVWP